MGWVRCGLGTPSSVLSLPTPSEASGVIAQFNTDLTENLLSAVAEFSASQASGTPTPANPIPIVGVDKVNVTRTQNNIFTSPIERGNISAYGENTDNLNPNRSRTAKQIAVSPSTGYTVGNAENYKVGIFYYTSNGTFISYLTWDDTPRTFTTPSNCAFVRFAYQNTSGTYPTKNQLCKGTTLDNYDQTVATALINLGGTYYGGEVDAVTGKITKQIDTYTITGEETSVQILQGSNNNGYRIGILLANSTNKYSGLLSSVSENASILNSATWEIGKFCTYSGRLYITVPNEYDTVAKALEYLTGGVFEYELATPLVVYASNTAEIPTIVGDNQVFADTGDVALKYFETVGHKI